MRRARTGRPWRAWLLALGASAILPTAPTVAETLTVAVASNFAVALSELAERFETASKTGVTVVSGSTGKHYAQIVHGAPFDIFFAADQERPQKLEEGGWAVSGSRFTYAVGRLVLWSPTPGLVDAEARVLESGRFRHLAMANPRLAPYGRAARETLERRGLFETLSDRLVLGENVAQAFQMIASGNAELGFVARSQLEQPGREFVGSRWPVPSTLHDPIEQQAVLLRDSPAGHAFLEFVQTPESRRLIRHFGYDPPDARDRPDSASAAGAGDRVARMQHAVR